MKKFLLFIVLFLFGSNIYASEYLGLVPINGVYSSEFNFDTGNYFSSNQKKYYMDDKLVYCIEPGVGIYTNYYDSVSDLSFMNSDLVDKLSLIGYFGYDYPAHRSDNYFLAAQELIWELVGNNDIYFSTGINGTGDVINIENEKDEIMKLVNNYYSKPSFDGGVISGVYGEQLVLVDTNNVLSDYEVVSSGNGVTIDGNSLIIDFNILGSDEITLKRKKYDDMVSLFYHSDDSQDFMFLRPTDLYSSVYIDTFISFSKININKNGLLVDDYDNDFIYSEVGLNGIIFGLYADEDIFIGDELVYFKDELISELQTVDGVVSSNNLPNGKYYLKELKTLDEFILDNSITYIELNNYDREVYNYMVNLYNDRKKVFISLNKKGEVFESDSSDFFYSTVGLEGVTFGLYSGSDIYDFDGNLIVKKNELIDSFVTDENGNIFEEVLIPFGTYYMKELETVEGYVIDSNIYEFSVNGSDDIINIMITKEPIVNELVKSNLIINKFDSFGNKLSGAHFKLFDDNNNMIYEGYTNDNGIICVENLPYGKYHFYEDIAPSGFYGSDMIYNFVVNHDNSFITVDVVNNRMPITSDIYYVPKKLSCIGLGFGLLTLSLMVIYDKKN